MRRALPSLVLAAGVVAGCGRGGAGAAPTFAKDVAPILFDHCASCHRPDQGAPFALLTFADAKAHADEIASETTGRHMPPWLPDAGQPGFVGERRLSADQIGTLRRWADAGAPEGDRRDLPPAPSFPRGWQAGTPDLVLTPAQPFVLEPQADNVFRNLVIRTTLPADRYVRAVEFQPGGAPVHHAVVHLDRTAASRRRDGADGRPGFDGMGAVGAQEPEGHFIGWAPGRGPIVSADGMPWRLARGTDLVVELHLIPGQAPVTVQPSIALFFADAAGAAVPLVMKMGSKAIDIPAGATDYAISDQYVLPADVDLLSLYPHAHFLGKDMQVSATLPDGSTRSLLHIRRWSFHWQQDYRFVAPVTLPRGTTVSMRFTYDNSDGNADNPHHPPVRVMVGQRSTDEMGNLLLQVVPRSQEDRLQLTRDLAAREAAANLRSAELLVSVNPDNAENQTFLGSSYVDVGRVPEGIARLEQALRLDPRSARAHNELGGALLLVHRGPEAVAHFRQAVAVSPDEARWHFNLGKALGATGAAADAGREFERALAINPDFAEAHDELGAWLFARGRLADALAHLRTAVELAPDSAVCHSDLGGALAEAGRFDEARAHLTRALALDPGNTAARENLARLRGRT